MSQSSKKKFSLGASGDRENEGVEFVTRRRKKKNEHAIEIDDLEVDHECCPCPYRIKGKIERKAKGIIINL